MATALRPTADTLTDVMEFDHVIQVHADGTVTHPAGIYAPEIALTEDEDGSWVDGDGEAREQARAQGWSLMAGYTGQYGAGRDAVTMHASEYIGEGLAEDILATPGLYVAIPIYSVPTGEDAETTVESWAVAYREMEA